MGNGLAWGTVGCGVPGPHETELLSQPPSAAVPIGLTLSPPGSLGDHEDPHFTDGETEDRKDAASTQRWAAGTRQRKSWITTVPALILFHLLPPSLPRD